MAIIDGILQADKTVFYLPCDQKPAQEIIKTKTWINQGDWSGFTVPDPLVLTSGIVASGFTDTGLGFVITHDSTEYQDITGSSGLCFASWIFSAADDLNFWLNIGFANAETLRDVENGINFNALQFSNATDVSFLASGDRFTFDTISETLSSPTFLVVDVRFSGGTTWLFRRSMNGSDWSIPLEFTLSSHFDNSPFVKLAFRSTDNTIDEAILWSDNVLFTSGELSNLFELGNTLSEPMTSYITTFVDPISTSGFNNMFIAGSGIIQETNTTDFFINGVEPKPALECPPLDPTASIQIKDSLIRIYQSRIDALINQLGKNITLEFDPIRTPCPNCTFDRIRNRSTGIFIPGGPRPFKRGRKCPWCKGRGLLETPVTKCIKCLIKWNPKDAEKFGISIGHKKGIVRFKTFLTEADDLMRARTAVSNKDIEDQLTLRVQLIQGPIPVGLRERRYCISFWELI